MIVTCGNQRFSLYHVVGVNLADQTVNLVGGHSILLDKPHLDAFVKFWDSHAEIIKPEQGTATDLPQPLTRDEREFPLGHEDGTQATPGN